MTRAELIDKIAQEQNIDRVEAERRVKAVFQVMTDGIVSGQRVTLRNFGAFWLQSYDQRFRRNPRTGETLSRSKQHSVRFKAGKGLRDRVNSGKG